jgi:hypothetical protein
MREFTEGGERDFRPDHESLQYIQLQPAVDKKSASFSQLFSAHYGAYYASDCQEARTWHYYYKHLIGAFQNENGRIVEQFHAPCPASAYLTEKGEEYLLFVAFWPDYLAFDSVPAQALLGKIIDLRDEAMQYLRSVQQRRLMMQKLFTLSTALIAAIRSEWECHESGQPGAQPSTSSFKDAIELLEERLAAIRQFYVKSATKAAQIFYFYGMMSMIAVLAIILSCLTLTTPLSRVTLAVIAAGAAGAFVSVASRITRGTPLVAYEESTVRLVIFGAIRPIIGGVLGAAVCAFVAAGLASALRVSPSTRYEVLLSYSAIAFVAGFSERFAQDVLLKTSSKTDS